MESVRTTTGGKGWNIIRSEIDRWGRMALSRVPHAPGLTQRVGGKNFGRKNAQEWVLRLFGITGIESQAASSNPNPGG